MRLICTHKGGTDEQFRWCANNGGNIEGILKHIVHRVHSHRLWRWHQNVERISAMTSLQYHVLLNPEIIYLNHGAFGACPKPVFETYQARQR